MIADVPAARLRSATPTEVGLVQAPFKTNARLALHRDGWSDSFDKLEALLAFL